MKKPKMLYILVRYDEEEIVGVVDSFEKVSKWMDSDMEGRDYKEFELNVVKCEECKDYWKFEK